MRAFVDPIRRLGGYDDMIKAIKNKPGLVSVSGCIDAQKPHMIYSLEHGKNYRLIVTFSDQRAKELQKVKTYIQNHRSDDKKKIAKWFQQYAADGVLTYERIKSKTGKDYYYKWTIIHPEGLAVSGATAKEPNEQ